MNKNLFSRFLLVCPGRRLLDIKDLYCMLRVSQWGAHSKKRTKVKQQYKMIFSFYRMLTLTQIINYHKEIKWCRSSTTWGKNIWKKDICILKKNTSYLLYINLFSFEDFWGNDNLPIYSIIKYNISNIIILYNII